MRLSFALTTTLLFGITQGLSVNFGSSFQMQIEDQKSELLVDISQAHYERTMDDILSQHNEDLLTKLSTIIKKPHQISSTLRPQAELLLPEMDPNSIQDVCIAQMPGIIANQIHELSSEIYSSISIIVAKNWKSKDEQLRQVILDYPYVLEETNEQDAIEALVTQLSSFNLNTVNNIVSVVQEFQMLNNIKQSLLGCQRLFDDNNSNVATIKFTERVWRSLLESVHQHKNIEYEEHQSFLNQYVTELINAIQNVLDSRVYELAREIYEDMTYRY